MSVTATVEKIGTFSKSGDKMLLPASPLPHLNEDKRLYGSLTEEMDLTIECGRFEDSENDDKIDPLLDFILQTSTHGTLLSEAIGARFLTTARILNSLARSEYSKVPLELIATRQSDVIFVQEKGDVVQLSLDSPIQYLQKFKQYMTLDQKGNPHDKYAKVEAAPNFSIVNMITLDSYGKRMKVVYSSRFDAVDEAGNFITLKTTVGSHKKWVEKQSLRQYLQSFLAGIPYTIFGHRVSTKAQSINKIEKMYTDNIPNERVTWKRDSCFEQLFRVLQKVESSLELDGDVAAVKVVKTDVTCEIVDIENFNYVHTEFLRNFD